MRAFLIIVCSLFTFLWSEAQVRISANPTGKHQKLIEQAKMGKKIYDFARQHQKDSITIIKRDSSLSKKEKRRQVKALRKRYSAKRRELKKLGKEKLEEETGIYLPDSITYPPKTPDDSLKWALQVLANEGQIEEIKKIHDAYSAVDTLSVDSLGYVAAQQSAKIAESFLPEDIKNLEAEPRVPDTGQLFMSDIPKSELPHLKLDELLEKAPDGNIDQAVTSLSNLKSNYLEMPDVRYPEKGIKKNSLKGAGLSKRIVFGGNAALQSTDPLISDLDLQLGLKLNKKWVAGAGIVWRESFGKQDSLSSAKIENAHGYSAFTYYKVIGNFFVYGEYLGMKDQALFNPSELDQHSRWQYEWLIGIGNEISLFSYVQLTMLVAYDINYKNNDLHPRPFILKIGYRISGLPFGKK